MSNTTADAGPRRFYKPGEMLRNERGLPHSIVVKVMYTGHGHSGVVLSQYNNSRYVWISDTYGNVKITMITTDMAAAVTAFRARVVTALTTDDGDDE